MASIALLSDIDLLARLPLLVHAEYEATADVIEHLVEVERRRLYLEEATSSLYKYCQERLGYSEDAALKRARVAKLALRVPRALDEVRTGAIHLTGLFLLERYLTEENAEAFLSEVRGKSRRALEQLIASRFPRPDVLPQIQPLGASSASNDPGCGPHTASGPSSVLTCPGTGSSPRPRIEPLYSAPCTRCDESQDPGAPFKNASTSRNLPRNAPSFSHSFPIHIPVSYFTFPLPPESGRSAKLCADYV